MTTLVGLTIADDPVAWRQAGFLVDGDRLTLGGLTLRFTGRSGSGGIVAWELDPPTESVDGLIHRPVGAPAASATHDNGALAVDHLVIATPDMERTTAALADIGLEPRRTVRGPRGDQDRLYRFFLVRTAVLELIGPTTPSSQKPARFAGLAVTVSDIDALGRWCPPAHAAVQPGRRITTLGRDVADVSVPLAFMTPRPTG